jgi:hypothetical protein
MTPIREYFPQIRNHPAPKKSTGRSRSVPSPLAQSCSVLFTLQPNKKQSRFVPDYQTQNRTAPFLESGMERLRLLDSSTKHYLRFLNEWLRLSSSNLHLRRVFFLQIRRWCAGSIKGVFAKYITTQGCWRNYLY